MTSSQWVPLRNLGKMIGFSEIQLRTMRFLITQAFAIISTLVLFARANQIPIPTPSCDDSTPVRPFTVKAFQSPYPDGQALTGLSMTAHSGNFFLTNQVPASDETVICVDGYSRAFLVRIPSCSAPDSHLTKLTNHSRQYHPQLSQIFIDASTGALHYSLLPHTPDPPGASYVLFSHNGKGNS